MIRHIVMWNVRGSDTDERLRNIELVRAAFERLRGRVPGLRHLEIGVDASRVDYACDVVLYSEFESWEALRAYAEHPEHLRVRDELMGIRIARHQVDYEVQPRAGIE
ncbi:MAG TPA: Dabb family protein [Burkholderiaceae bacterium]|nr:Dabb family protein [Burkholderiaceae bacterium]